MPGPWLRRSGHQHARHDARFAEAADLGETGSGQDVVLRDVTLDQAARLSVGIVHDDGASNVSLARDPGPGVPLLPETADDHGLLAGQAEEESGAVADFRFDPHRATVHLDQAF